MPTPCMRQLVVSVCALAVVADAVANQPLLADDVRSELELAYRAHLNRPLHTIPVTEAGTTFGHADIAALRRRRERRGTPGTDDGPEPNTTWERSRRDVSCGGHRAAMCSLCPQGNGAAWCNGGDCVWSVANNECEAPPLSRCDDAGVVRRQSCSECSAAECTGTLDCQLMPATNLCRYTHTDDTRTASVNLVHTVPPTLQQPDARPAWWFQRLEIVSSTDVSYFMPSGHSFGYAGFQQSRESPFQGRVVFSIWDQGGCDQDVDPDCPPDQLAQTIQCGTGIKCTGFGGEGTGRKSIVYSNTIPVVDRPYYLATHAAQVGPTRMQYAAYFYVPGGDTWGASATDGAAYADTQPGWRFLCKIEVSTNPAGEWWLRNLYSFVEQWSPVSGLADRAALFGPGFLAPQAPNASTPPAFEQITRVTFDYGTLENHKYVNAYAEDESVGLETGGSTVQVAPRYQVFTVPTAEHPAELLTFQAKAGCIAAAVTVDETEACLDATPAPATPAPTPAPTTSEPTPSPTPAPNYCLDGYDDYGVRYNWGLGLITIAFTHQQCSDRCTQYSAPQFNGGCKGYMTGMYFGMLFCRSYGGDVRTQPCASWAKPDEPGVGSGLVGSTHALTNQENIGGNCCSNSTFVLADTARLAK